METPCGPNSYAKTLVVLRVLHVIRARHPLSNYCRHGDWLTIDADVVFAPARFRDSAPDRTRIPGAVEGVAPLAVAVGNLGPWIGALQFRYFGPRPLSRTTRCAPRPALRNVALATRSGRSYASNSKVSTEQAQGVGNRLLLHLAPAQGVG